MWGHVCPARPDQDVASLIDRHALALNEFILQIVERGIVELELPLQGAVGQATPALEHRDRLVENLLKGHRSPDSFREAPAFRHGEGAPLNWRPSAHAVAGRKERLLRQQQLSLHQ